jgi:putative membrane protein
VHHHPASASPTSLLVAALLAALLAYGFAAWVAWRRGRPWSWRRSLLWLGGVLACLAALVGPLAEGVHGSPAQMAGHVLLGMAGPLLLVRGAPVTLALRALPVRPARLLVRVLHTRWVRFVSHPVVAGVLDLGGLWLLYGSGHPAWAADPWGQLLAQIHVVAAGFLFAQATVGVDPQAARASFRTRAVVLVLFAAGHAILAKRLYASPPAGVPTQQAERGAMVMYYGGDLVDLVLFVLLWSAWYSSTGRRRGARRAAPVGGRGTAPALRS